MTALPLFPAKGRPRARRAPKPPSPKEFQIQIAVASHLRHYADPRWRWTHIPNGEDRHPRVGAKLKAMGVQPGWPDLICISPEGVAHFLELKRRGEKIEMGSEQDRFQAWCVVQAIEHAVADNVDDAIRALERWGVLRTDISIKRVEEQQREVPNPISREAEIPGGQPGTCREDAAPSSTVPSPRQARCVGG